MITAIDTNVLLDILTNDPMHASASQLALERAYGEGPLVISDIVYAELVPQYTSRDELDEDLSNSSIQFLGCGPDVAWLAGRKWMDYRKSGGPRTRLLADFLIGAHAQVCADRLLTRDRGFYRTHFTELQVCEP